jgi:predicted MPP superfamily phosphohydrolase
LLSALGVVGFWSFIRVTLMDTPRDPWRVRLLEIPYFVHWCACLFALVPTILAAVGAPALRALGFDASATSAAMWSYGAGLVVCFWGVVVRRWWFVVEHVDVSVENLPSALEGFRIAQLSDLHIGAYTPPAWGERWARAVNEARADLVVVTGDMVTSGVAFHDAIAAIIGSLRARHGVFVSMGNHDYFGEGEPLVSLIDATGTARVLRNEGLTIEHDDGTGQSARLFLAAIDDVWTRRDDLARALSERPEGIPTVLLAHDPERFRPAAKQGVDLVLSGHTHGGQVGVPFLAKRFNLSKIAHHYTLGTYRRGKSTLHVHPGLGVTGPPIRLGVAPAVVILTLRAA